MRLRIAGALLACLFLVSPPHAGAQQAKLQIIYGDLGQVGTVNPVTGGAPAERRLQQLLFNGLLEPRMVNTGKRFDLVYMPILASSFEYDNQNDVYIFTLRDKVSFHDGSILSVRDVATTIRALVDPKTSVGNPMFREYLGPVETLGSKIRVKLKRTPWNKWELFTFGVMREAQLAVPMQAGFSLKAQGTAWQNLEIVKNPIGTGPFKLAQKVSTDGIDRLRLLRNGGYFETPKSPAEAGNVQEIIYTYYDSLATENIDVQDRKITVAMQAYGLNTDDYNLVKYGNDAIYYLGFNYRKQRKVTVCTFPQAGRGREYRSLDLALTDILLSPDLTGGETVGRAFRRLIGEGIDREALLRAALKDDKSEDLSKRLQTSIFPIGPFPERPEVVKARQYLPGSFAESSSGQLVNILNSYLQSRRKPYFNYTSRSLLANFMSLTGITANQGLFTLNSQPNQALTLKMIYSASDRMMTDSQVMTNILMDSFLRMGIVLQLVAIDEFNFAAAVQEGDWDLILSSYDVPSDYNVSKTFSSAGSSRENLMAFSDPDIETVVSNMSKASVEIEYAARLEELNLEIMKKLPAILLFGIEYSAGFSKDFFTATTMERMDLLASDRYFFGQTDKWSLR